MSNERPANDEDVYESEYPQPTHEEIAIAAYYLSLDYCTKGWPWWKHSYPPSDEYFWLRAEKILKGKK